MGLRALKGPNQHILATIYTACVGLYSCGEHKQLTKSKEVSSQN